MFGRYEKLEKRVALRKSGNVYKFCERKFISVCEFYYKPRGIRAEFGIATISHRTFSAINPVTETLNGKTFFVRILFFTYTCIVCLLYTSDAAVLPFSRERHRRPGTSRCEVLLLCLNRR